MKGRPVIKLPSREHRWRYEQPRTAPGQLEVILTGDERTD